MKLFKRSYFDVATLSVLFEIVLFSLIYFTIGFLYNKSDPLLFSSEINFLLILLSTITLFYGLNKGLILLVIFAGVMFLYYKPFPFMTFVENLIIVLICGEFHFFYKRTIRRLNEEHSYITSKFNQLRNSFYLLKLSHDQLERSFLLKPVSIRSILDDIKSMLIWDKDEAAKKLVNLIAKNLGVVQAGLFLIAKDELKPTVFINEEFKLNKFNMLLKKAMEEKRATFISEEFENLKNYEYIAVIPAINCEDTIVGYLIIKEMKFLSYNRENMLTISIIMSIFADFLTQNEVLDKLNAVSEVLIFEPEFNYELIKLYSLKEKFDITSTYVIFRYTPDLQINKNRLFDFIRNSIRTVDLVYELQNSIVVLLPLISLDGAKSFQSRINNLIRNKLNFDPDKIDERIIVFSDYNTDIQIIKEYAN
ncbi:MAG: PelD GGDEF domain-containing protein [Calditerrivibrio sp.]|nr:PelD GGDEF domain-containing protein [Calditerrivibrio sp.]